MEEYIKGNKEAWEEAFENRDEFWGNDINEKVLNEDYPFFNEETRNVLRKIDTAGKVIGQFCCNNGRELLSLVKSGKARKGVGFDIAENQVRFANGEAKKLNLPCYFEAMNIYDIPEEYNDNFDVALITIGALCWFEDLERFFEVVSRCMKHNATIIINEQHPFTNMIATEDEEVYDPDHPMECQYSYFKNKWITNNGMYYITKKRYDSKPFTDYTHSLSEIIHAMGKNKLYITDLKEYDYDISGMFEKLDHHNFPLSMIIEGRKF